MNMEFYKAGVCAAVLTLASTSLYAEESGPSRPFFGQMVLQGVTFQVETPNDSSINTVTVRAMVDGKTFAEEGMEADGTITGLEVEDLNADGYPEVYVYVTSAGSGSYASLAAYAANDKKSLSPIYLPPLADNPKLSKGYMGHDQLSLGDGFLLQRFALYRDGDSNAKPSGGIRQIQYTLVTGEAGWQLKVDGFTEY